MNPGVRLAESLVERLGCEKTISIAPSALVPGIICGELVIITAERAEEIATRLQRQDAELRRLRRKRKGSHA